MFHSIYKTNVVIIGLIFLSFTLFFPFTSNSQDVPTTADEDFSGKTCDGSFANPFKDICWDCILPLTIGPVEVFPSALPDFGNNPSPLCFCGTPLPRIGISIGIWEPVRLVDVVQEEWCFPALGGLKLDPGIGFASKSLSTDDAVTGDVSYHSHWYIFPVFYIFELLQDFICLENSAFDLGYVTEFDPLWQDDTLSLLLNAEALLFANPLAQSACVADCAAASVTHPIKELFWCMGCNGSTYPFNGNVSHNKTPTQSSLLVAQRMAFKLHRQFVAFQTSTTNAECSKKPQPLMDKRQYRFQMINPSAHTKGPFKCPRIGSPTATYENFKMKPVVGENHSFLLFRKRNCCAL